MNTTAVLTASVVAFAGLGVAEADRPSSLQFRQINTAPRLIGCSRNIEFCGGASSTRTGLVVADLASRDLRRGPVALIAMFQASAQPKRELLGSQVMIGGGSRLSFGRSWIQGGLGLAGLKVAPGPKTIPATSLLHSHIPAAMAGIGTRLEAFDVPLQLSLDLGTSLGVLDDDHFGDIYQVTANVLAYNL
jgi:hypothetical protein